MSIKLNRWSSRQKLPSLPIQKVLVKNFPLLTILGLCDLSCDMVLAYPNSRGTSKGNVVLYNLLSLQQKRLIEGVHDHPLSYIQFSSDGRYVATTSECGTLVRVCNKILEDVTTYRR
eukprot:TRINITY_DN2421_c0_g3_i2.p1 TRINITY_DN2421_c0_g3~~TRINITY_DN2421_c0_g3_i2.p1  ORF type:complete len:117 (+),score=12.50 TRINITY_DN2421_c0_g3_i2:485-835(+)